MHFICKEILKLVRASSALHRITDRSRRARAAIFDQADPNDPEYDTESYCFELLQKIGHKIELRVIVDILASASAGWIKATMLARALSHDLPILRQRDLWLVSDAAMHSRLRRRVKNGYGGCSTGTSAVPQIADDFGAPRKSAEWAKSGIPRCKKTIKKKPAVEAKHICDLGKMCWRCWIPNLRQSFGPRATEADRPQFPRRSAPLADAMIGHVVGLLVMPLDAIPRRPRFSL
jgi:hypothetical protein